MTAASYGNPKIMLDANWAPPAGVIHGWVQKYKIAGMGFYLGGPFYAGGNWTHQLLKDYAKVGITGFAPIYVGQQTGPGLGTGNYSQGTHDGKDAVAQMAHFGFHKPGYIFLDVESATVDNVDPDALHRYINDWCNAVTAAGYWPGVYGPPRMMASLQGTKTAFIWVAAYVANGFISKAHPDSAPGLDPQLWPKHRMWQYAGDVRLEGNDGQTYDIDIGCYNHYLDGAPS